MSNDVAEKPTSGSGRLPSEVLRPQIKRALESWLEYAMEINAEMIRGVVTDPAKLDEEFRWISRYHKLVKLAAKLDAKKPKSLWERIQESRLTT